MSVSALYSEEDFIIKFWSYIFETFFGTDQNLFIHWGDTQASTNKKNGLKLNLDMRIMIMKNTKYLMEGSDCEYARKPFPSKYFKDRLKLILATKAYSNDLVNNSPCLSKDDIVCIKIPFIQTMGFEGLLSVMYLKDKCIYVVEDVQKFIFPTTKKQIRKEGINNLVKFLSVLHRLLENVKEYIEEGTYNHDTNLMANISNGTRPSRNKTNKDWINKIICPVESSDEESEDEEDEEDEEKEV